jgi:hypothetical protein
MWKYILHYQYIDYLSSIITTYCALPIKMVLIILNRESGENPELSPQL